MNEFDNNTDNFGDGSNKPPEKSDIIQNNTEEITNIDDNVKPFYIETIRTKKKKFNFKKSVGAVCIISILSGLCLGFGTGATIPLVESFVSQYSSNKKNESVFNQQITSVSHSNTVNIIKKVTPSVVAITSRVQGQDIFNTPYEQAGSGSGIIFHQTGNNVYIVTNFHVVESASDVGVSIQNNDLVPAKLVGKDVLSDLAVISVDKNDLKREKIDSISVAEFGDSDAIQAGDPVIAIGNALGEGNISTRGIVSAVKKDINVQGRKLHVLQTDAAINPGNSGGPLINSSGEVIGINAAKLEESNVEGVGYSITSNIAKPIIEKLMHKSDSPQLGVYISNIPQDIPNLPKAGVWVSEIIKGGSAEKAGIRKTDIITGFNGQPIFAPDQLTEAVQKCDVGDTVEVKLIRNGNENITIKLKLLVNTDTSF